jgi:hypothetical protein
MLQAFVTVEKYPAEIYKVVAHVLQVALAKKT